MTDQEKNFHGNIHLRIEEAMILREMTVSELSHLSGLSRPTIYKLKRDNVSRIELETLARLCHALEMPVQNLLYYEPKGQKIMPSGIG